MLFFYVSLFPTMESYMVEAAAAAVAVASTALSEISV